MPAPTAPPSAKVIFSTDVREISTWADRTGIPMITTAALEKTWERAKPWLRILKDQLVQNHHWKELGPEHRMLFTIESESPWRGSNNIPLSPKLTLRLPSNAASFWSPDRRVRWEMVFHSDIFESQRKLLPPLQDMFNVIQCLITGLVVLMHEERESQVSYVTSRGLPRVEWVHTNESNLIHVFGKQHYQMLLLACGDPKRAFKLEVRPHHETMR